MSCCDTTDVPASDGPDTAELQAQVEEALDGRIRQLLQSHGGDVSVRQIDGGAVTLELHGRCQICPSFGVTLHAVIEPHLHATVPDIDDVSLHNRKVSSAAAESVRTFFGIDAPRHRSGGS